MCKQHVSDISMWSFLQFVLKTKGDIKLTEKYIHLCFQFGNDLCGSRIDVDVSSMGFNGVTEIV